jgi:nicotinate phosphoribosyltransferase
VPERALLTDLYELTMLEAYFDHGMTETAVFELFVRRLPSRRGFLVAAGLDQALEYLETLRFSDEELDWLRAGGRFKPSFVDRLAALRFTGDVDAMPEGTLCFADEPILRVTAPLPEAQLVETRLINLVHFQTLIASKAARFVLAAPGKQLVDFGLRRAHGAEAGLLAARASYLAGFSGTSNVAAGARWNIPTYGTMAHSYVEAHDHEADAFVSFARSRPHDVVLLIDTYDTENAAHVIVELAPELRATGVTIAAVRLDSGSHIRHARAVRQILDAGGLKDVHIFASGGLDEDEIAILEAAGAPIDGYGPGTSLVTSSDAPFLDCAYKLTEYAGLPRYKRSEGKATRPGVKQVFRVTDRAGRMAFDHVALAGEPYPGGVPLLEPAMRAGRRVARVPLEESRRRAAAQLAGLPAYLRRVRARRAFPVRISAGLQDLSRALPSPT